MKSRPQTVKYPQVMDEKQNRQESRSINLGSVPGLPRQAMQRTNMTKPLHPIYLSYRHTTSKSGNAAVRQNHKKQLKIQDNTDIFL